MVRKKMINCKIAMCAESVVVDKNTNNVSVFNMIEELKSHGFPVLSRKLVYFFFMTRDKTNAEVQKGSLVISLDGEELNRFPVQIDFHDKLRTRAIITIEGYLIPKPGTLSAVLILRGKEYGRWEVDVQQIGKPKVEASQG